MKVVLELIALIREFVRQNLIENKIKRIRSDIDKIHFEGYGAYLESWSRTNKLRELELELNSIEVNDEST